MAIGSLLASRLARSGHALATRAIAQAPRTHNHHHAMSPLLSKLGAVARAFSSRPAAADVIRIDLGTTNSCVSVMEGKVMPYSTGCKTALSNFEAGLDYRGDRGRHVVVLFVPSPDYGRPASRACCSSDYGCPANPAYCS